MISACVAIVFVLLCLILLCRFHKSQENGRTGFNHRWINCFVFGRVFGREVSLGETGSRCDWSVGTEVYKHFFFGRVQSYYQREPQHEIAVRMWCCCSWSYFINIVQHWSWCVAMKVGYVCTWGRGGMEKVKSPAINFAQFCLHGTRKGYEETLL